MSLRFLPGNVVDTGEKKKLKKMKNMSIHCSYFEEKRGLILHYYRY